MVLCVPATFQLFFIVFQSFPMAASAAAGGDGGGWNNNNWRRKQDDESDIIDVPDDEDEQEEYLRWCSFCKRKAYLRKGGCANQNCVRS